MPIQILPAQLANQIAAGEVVERPASVVKELIENCLDAGATKIEIEIDKGGHKRILVRDDGKGIAKDELQLALSRHATSKIKSLADLEAIACLGFRGEALASISSVSRLTLTSKPQAQTQAWQACTQGRDMQVQLMPAAHPQGSSVEVLDLFFNTPARRKFLRAEKTEFAHIDEVVKRIALSRFDVGFVLKHNGKPIKQLASIKASADPFTRVKKLCGSEFSEHAMAIESDYQNMRLRGWIASSVYARKQNDLQYFYLNGRVIRDKLINHAIRQSLQDRLPEDAHPAYVLYLELPAGEVDVNVHPSKHEVRFHHSRLVHDFVLRSLTDVQMQPIVDAVADNKFNLPASHNYIKPLETIGLAGQVEEVSQSSLDTYQGSDTRRAFPRQYQGGSNSRPSQTEIQHYRTLMQPEEQVAGADTAVSYLLLPQQRVLLQCRQLHYLVTLKSIWMAQLKNTWLQHPPVAQPLLMPVSIAAKRQLVEAAQSLHQALLNCAVELSWSDNRVILRKVPAGCRNLPWSDMLTDLLSLELADGQLALSDFLECIGQATFALDDTQEKQALVWLEQQQAVAIDAFVEFFRPARVPLNELLSEYDA